MKAGRPAFFNRRYATDDVVVPATRALKGRAKLIRRYAAPSCLATERFNV